MKRRAREETEDKSLNEQANEIAPSNLATSESPIDSAPAPKKQKVFQNLNKQVDKIPPSDRCLDELARLFQMTSQGCAAVCLMDKTIVITDNDIHAGSTLDDTASVKVKLIKTVMQYFSDFANENKAYNKSREKVFKEICTARLKGEEKGYIKLDDKILETIAKDILDTYKVKDQEDWRIQYAKKIHDYDPNQRPYVAVAYEIAALIARDFFKIEQFIEANRDNDTSDLVMAFKGQENQRIFMDQAGGILEDNQGLVQVGEESGYIILNIDAAGVHAEAKIIEYLIFTGITNNLEDDEKIYIGISKLCCKGCDAFVKAVNEVFASKVEIIQIRGTHGLQPKWVQPMICNDYTNEQVLGYYCSEETQQLEPVTSDQQEEFATMYKCIYLVNSKQIKTLNESAPELKQLSTNISVYQVAYSKSSAGSQSPSTHDEEEEKLTLTMLTTDQLLEALMERYSNPDVNNLVFELKEKLHNFKEKEVITEYDIHDESLQQDTSSSGHKNILDPGYWYKDEDVNNLLNAELRDKAIIMAAAKFKNREELKDRIENGVTDWIKNPLQPIVIPINLHDNHWTALVIKKQGDGSVQVIYNDPKGRSIQNEENAVYLVQIITGVLGEHTNIIDLQVVQQPGRNDDDCGAFTVDNLIRLVNNDTSSSSIERLKQLLPIPKDGNANHIRIEHTRLLHLEQENLQHTNDTDSTQYTSMIVTQEIQQEDITTNLAGLSSDLHTDSAFGSI